MPPDYVVIGHITRDVTPDGYTTGGTVTYAGLTARNLGCRVGIVTSHGPELELDDLLSGIELHAIPSDQTTTFENIYRARRREQYIRAVASPIPPQAIPEPWRRAPIAHLAPLADELPPEIIDAFDDTTLIGVTPQGWMRRWDDGGRVWPKPWECAEQILVRADVLVFSEEDVLHIEDAIQTFANMARIMVVTHGAGGATLYLDGQPHRYPAFVAQEVDPTGAGDVFAAAFLIHLHQSGDPHAATHFANCVASFAVEAPGIQGIPTREQVEERLSHGKLRSTREGT
jgi:sugar/nucleoside kinase (ribokinase family)